MAERASVLQGAQIGIESTAGTAVAAGKKLLGTSIEAGIQTEINTFKPYGSKYNTISALGKEWVEADISGPLCYGDWTYLAACGIAYAAPVQNGATIAYTHTHTPAMSTEDVVKTLTVETGGTVRAHKFAYGLITQLGYTITRKECMVKGKMIGQRITDSITLTATPTDIALQPVLPTEISIYADDTAAGLGTTKLLRVLNWSFDFSDRSGPVWPVDAAQTSFAATVETEPKTEFKVLLAADAVGMGLLTTMRAGSKKFFRVGAVGPVIVGAETYLWNHDICGTVSSVAPFKDEDGIYAIEWTFLATYDSTWAKAMTFNEVNTISAL